MAFDYSSMQKMADQMIREYGAAALLRRSDGDRDCFACVIDYTPAERQGKLINPTDRLALISVTGPDGNLVDPPPNKDLDKLVTFIAGTDPPEEDEVLSFRMPVGKIAPAGTVVYWEASVFG